MSIVYAYGVPFDDIELRHLAALRAVAEEGSFIGAADALGYSQAAISQQIAALEDKDPALKGRIEEFRADEAAHRDEAISRGAEGM